MNENTKSAFKMKALKYLLIFLTIMIAMTFISRGVYAYKLPRISVSHLKYSSIEHNIRYEGMIESTKQIPVITLPELRAEEIYVNKGDIINENDPLIKIDKAFLEEYTHKLSIQIETDKLTRDDDYQMSAWNSAKILTYSIQENQKVLDKYIQILNGDCIIHSGSKGMITSVNIKPGDITTQTACIMMADLSENLFFTAEVSKEESKFISLHDKVSLSFRNGKVLLDNCEITLITDGESPDTYKIRVPVQSSDITIGETGSLLNFLTSEGQYDCVPVQAIHESGGRNYVYVVTASNSFLGEENRVTKKMINVIDKNNSLAAIENSGLNKDDQIVLDSDKELSNGQIVRFAESSESE